MRTQIIINTVWNRWTSVLWEERRVEQMRRGGHVRNRIPQFLQRASSTTQVYNCVAFSRLLAASFIFPTKSWKQSHIHSRYSCKQRMTESLNHTPFNGFPHVLEAFGALLSVNYNLSSVWILSDYQDILHWNLPAWESIPFKFITE